MNPTRVLIISAHPLFREGMIRLLSQEADVVGAVANWDEAKALDLQHRPQAIIVDHDDADLKEADLAPLLWPDAEDLRVIFVTLAGDRMTIHERRQVTGAGESDLLRALQGQQPPIPGPSIMPAHLTAQGRTNRMDRSQNRRHLIIVSVLVAIVTILTVLFLENATLQQQPASAQAGPIDSLLGLHLRVISFLFALIMVFIVYSLVVFRRRAGDEGDGVHFHGNTRLEIVWTIIPLITVLIFSYLGAQSLEQVVGAKDNEMVVEVTALRYAWFFNYPEEGIQNAPELVLPIDQPVLLKITATDVIHDFWVPEFRVKQDAVPGLVTELRIQPTKQGDFKVRCDELCGVGHHAMLANIRVVDRAAFDLWVGNQVAAGDTAGDLSEAAQRGMELAVVGGKGGCTACHNVSGDAGGVGPTWKGLFGTERQFADGSTAVADETYLRSSIVNSAAQVVAGYSPIMPNNYGDLLSEAEISDLIEYIKSLANG